MSDGNIHLEFDDGVGVLALDRPPVNAINLDLAGTLVERLEQLSQEKLDALLLTGRNNRFSAGLDLKEVLEYDNKQQGRMVELVNRIAIHLYGFPKPVIAAVTGHAIAGGMILVLASDYRIGPLDDARFGVTETRVGIPVPGAAMEMVRASLSPHVARRLLLRAELVGPEEALKHGLLDELIERGSIRKRAREIAGELATYPAYSMSKKHLKQETLRRMQTAAEDEPLKNNWVTKDARKAVKKLLDEL